MKKIFTFMLALLLAQVSLFPQNLVTSVEAESGVLAGPNTRIAAAAGNSSGPYVTGFQVAADKVTVTVTIPSNGNYKLGIQYRSSSGDKTQDVFINNAPLGGVVFPLSTTFVEKAVGTVALNAGTNTIAVQKNWGYMDVDKFNIYSIPPNVFTIAPTLIDPLADSATKKLYSFLVSQFGQKIISGHTNSHYDSAFAITGKKPLLRSWDFATYSPKYAYAWINGAHGFGPVNNQDAEGAINWYNNTNKKGIVNIHWHWHSPSGGTAGTNTFYQQYTTFDANQAIIPGTQQNTDVIRDIDAIAVQLQKLENAGVPVLWRPLHEAGGTWFWWGSKGAATAKALWDIMYNRLANYHGLHNLIWVWSTPESAHYPGNSKVDIFGFDSYPSGTYNYTVQKAKFDSMYLISGGTKLLAITENGPIPTIQNCFDGDAKWSYFMTWNSMIRTQNSVDHVNEVYNDPRVLTLDNVGTLPVTLLDYSVKLIGTKAKLEWSTAAERNNARFDILRSSDGIHFYLLGTVKAKTPSSTNNYFIYDNTPSKGINYYRLVQYDADGKSTDFGTKTIRYDLSVQPSVKAYPNPAGSSLGVLLRNYEGRNITVSISSLPGSKLYQQTITTTTGEAYYRIGPAQQLPAGVYLLQVSGTGLQESMKVVVE